MPLLRFVKVGDNHGGEQEDVLVEKFFEWLKDFRPQLRIHTGDAFNFAALRKKASPEDKAVAIAPDYEAGNDFMARLFDGGTEKYFLRGNHDERIYNQAETTTDAVLQHYASKMVTEIGVAARKRNVRMLPYDSSEGVLDVHGVRAIHGYAAGIGAARKFAFVYGSCSFGHTHAMDVCPVEHWPETAIAYGTGCMCKIRQPYNRTQVNTLRHENGWLYGFTDGTRATYYQAKFKDGRIHVASEFKTY